MSNSSTVVPTFYQKNSEKAKLKGKGRRNVPGGGALYGGRKGLVFERAELAKMQAGVKAYVEAQLKAGKEVCPILTKYVTELDMGHKQQ